MLFRSDRTRLCTGIVEENGTTYYVKELTRSEGYELSVNGKTNTITNGRDNYEGEYHEADISIGKITLDMVGNGNYFDVTAYQADHDITLHGIKFPEGAVFELSTSEKVPEKIMVPVYSTVLKPVMAAAGTFVYRSGQKVAAARGDVGSEERRVGKESLRLCRSRWSPYH